MKKKKFLFTILAVCSLLALPAVALAANDQVVLVGTDEIINGNLIKAGQLIDVAGAVNGDVIAIGNTINISGPVAGDVIAIGNTVKISGPVSGSVRVVASTLEIDSEIEKNVWVFASNVVIGNKSIIGWDVRGLAASITIKGPVSGEVAVSAASVVITEKVGKNVSLNLGRDGQATLSRDASVTGDLTYQAANDNQLVVESGAKIKGKTERRALLMAKKDWSGVWGVTAGVFSMFAFFSLLVVGLVLIGLLPKKVLQINDEMINRPYQSIGVGILYLLVTPVIVFLLAVTVIGLPLSLILLAIYFISLFVSKILAAFMVGLFILNWLSKQKKYKKSLIWPLILGSFIFVVICGIPYLGWIVKLVLTGWALGAIINVEKSVWKSYR